MPVILNGSLLENSNRDLVRNGRFYLEDFLEKEYLRKNPPTDDDLKRAIGLE
ncbi:MAG: hypothetical protein K9G62_07740 [Alphaproteobacteria bacterium]|nr:hypothetical protein [Alphaproteobacteria bacterium]